MQDQAAAAPVVDTIESSAPAALITELAAAPPSITVEEGLARTVAFIRDNPALYRPAEYAV